MFITEVIVKGGVIPDCIILRDVFLIFCYAVDISEGNRIS